MAYEDTDSTGADVSPQDGDSTGAEGDGPKVELSPEAQQDLDSKGDAPAQQDPPAGDAPAPKDGEPAGDPDPDAAKVKADAEEAARRQEQSEIDRQNNLRQLERRARNAEQALQNRDQRARRAETEAEAREWRRKRDSEDPAERDEYLEHDRKKETKGEAFTAGFEQGSNKTAGDEFNRALDGPFFKESGLTPEEIGKAINERVTQGRNAGEAEVPYSELISAVASRVVEAKGAELTTAQGKIKELETKITSMTAQLTDAGIDAGGAPPRSPNGASRGSGLTTESYAKQLKDGDETDVDAIDKMTAKYL